MFRPRGSARNGRPWSRGKAAHCTQATPPPTIAAPMRGDPTHSATGPHQATPRAHASVRCPTYPCGSCAQRKEPCSSEHLLRACVPRTHAVRTHSAAPQLHSGQQCHRDAGRGCITGLQRISHQSTRQPSAPTERRTRPVSSWSRRPLHRRSACASSTSI